MCQPVKITLVVFVVNELQLFSSSEGSFSLLEFFLFQPAVGEKKPKDEEAAELFPRGSPQVVGE